MMKVITSIIGKKQIAANELAEMASEL